MDIGGGMAVAAGPAHVVEYVLATDTLPVPRTPAHCAGLMVWRDRLIPVVDLARLLTGRGRAPGAPPRAVVLAYQQAAGRPLQYGAMYVDGPPAQATVSDDMACTLPAALPALPHLARACFRHHDRAVAILDARQLFDRPLPAVAAPSADVAPVVESHEQSARAPVIELEILNERRPDRAATNPVPYLHVVPSAPASPIETAPAPAEHGVDEPLPVPAEVMLEETIDFEWPSTADSRVEPVTAESSDQFPLADDTLSPAEIAPLPAVAAAATGIPTAADTVAASTRASSNTVRSFERLHDLERRHTAAAPRRRGWLVAAAVAAVLLLIGAWILVGPDPAPDSPEAPPATMVQDAASLAVPPESVPTTPAQPPK
jgi:chemotaxis signal transduction protein